MERIRHSQAYTTKNTMTHAETHTMAQSPSRTRVRVAIIGSGFGGLGTAIQLKRRGMNDFVVLERAGDVGGVWRDNSYPGAACDVPSHLYSFSFAPNPAWSHSYSSQPEIWAYLQRCARDFGVLPHIRFHHEVREAAWDDAGMCWRIETAQGGYDADILVAAAGALSEPAIPQLPGLDSFQGAMFHSARWNHDIDMAGRRVAAVGTGASAIQFVPAIQPLVERLYVFQRTPPWILPRLDRPFTEREHWWFRHVPLAQRLARLRVYLLLEMNGVGFRHPRFMATAERIARRHLEESVPDPVLRARLTPNYTIGCKRVLVSDDYLPALTQPNVEVIPSAVTRVCPHGVVGEDGVEREVDVIIFGTGFQVTNYPFGRHIRGRDGRSLAERWRGSPQAYLGTTVAGYPNLFILQGPNTGLGHTSVIYMIEAQIAHIVNAIRYMDRHGVAGIEPRPEVQTAFVAEVDRRMQSTVWMAGGCRSWYLDATGRNATLWPGSTLQFWRRAARFAPSAYQMLARQVQDVEIGRMPQ
jgi:cation diffusion facilitator CzcD-associated flavoprotein CzcO